MESRALVRIVGTGFELVKDKKSFKQLSVSVQTVGHMILLLQY